MDKMAIILCTCCRDCLSSVSVVGVGGEVESKGVSTVTIQVL